MIIKKNISYAKAQTIKATFEKFGLILSIAPTQPPADLPSSFTLEKPQSPNLQEFSQNLEHFMSSIEPKKVNKYIDEIDDQQLEGSIPATFSLSTDGRFGIFNFLNAQLYLILALLPFALIYAVLQQKLPTHAITTIALIALVGIYAIYTFRMLILRLHDLDKSSWYLGIFLLIRVPHLGIAIIALFIIYLVTARGSAKMNQFGPPSERGVKTGAIVLALAILVLLGTGTYVSIHESAPKPSFFNIKQ